MAWITVDGLDGSGKGHAIQVMKNKLEEKGYKVILLRAMGSGKVGQVIREEIIHGRVKNNAEAVFALAAHLDHHNEAVKHLKKKNTVIISDRSLASFYAYQYTANHDIGSDTILKYLIKDFIFTNKPTHALFVDVKPEIAKARTASRPDANSIDNKDINYYKKVEEGFKVVFDQKLTTNAFKPTKSYMTISNNHSLSNFEKKLNKYINELFGI